MERLIPLHFISSPLCRGTDLTRTGQHAEAGWEPGAWRVPAMHKAHGALASLSPQTTLPNKQQPHFAYEKMEVERLG